MLDRSLFRSMMAYHNETQYSLAPKLGITPNSVSSKVRGKRAFSVAEIEKLKKLWGLTPEQINEIFFEKEK